MAVNPFLYGCIARAEHYCPRARLQKRLSSFFRSGQNVAVMGPRRVGKSSLIHHTAGKIRGATLVYADLWGVRTLDDFIRRCVQALDAIKDKASLLEKVSRAIPGLTITMSVDPVTGVPSMTPATTVRKRRSPESVAQIARLWASLGDDKRKIIVALDEFQDAAAMEDADQILGILRREIQTLGTIPFCFSGSVRSDMWRLFADEGAAFYKSAAILDVSSDDFDDWKGFLRGKFQSGRLSIHDEILDEIIRLADSNPGDTQQLCAAVWDAGKSESARTLNSGHVMRALLQVFADERKGYEQIVVDVSSQQLAVLRTIAQLGGASIQSADFLTFAGITHASSAKAAATRLVRRRVLQETPDGLKFSNPFFRAWLTHVRF